MTEDRFVEVKGVKLRYRDTGGAGIPLLLTHGISESLELWERQLDDPGATHRIIAWDVPNHGLSGLTGKTEDYASYTAWALDFADAIGLTEFVAVGNSMGAAMSLRMAGKAPQRIKGLVLANASALGREVTPVFRMFSIPFLGELMNKPSEKGVAMQIGAIVKDPACVTPDLHKALMRNAFKEGGTKAFLATLRALLGVGGQKKAEVEISARLLASVKCPILIIHGREDKVVPVAHSEAAAARAPGADLLILDDCGHTPQLEKPQIFNDALTRFTAKLA